ncbi:MAG: hypothetical protein LBE59_10655 [Nevskiaceae bacterium]|nr:hypothetical protein [Nevskiaceae bacterium]
MNAQHLIRLCPLLALLLCASSLAAAPSWRGLNVEHEALDSIESVNDLPVSIERFVGRDVPELLSRWLAEWKADPGTVAMDTTRSGDWLIHSRLLHPQSQELLQVRGQGAATELLWSRMALREPASGVTRGPPLPAGCRAGPRMRGVDEQGAYDMSMSICRGSAATKLLAQQRERGAAKSCVPDAQGESQCVVPMSDEGREKAVALIEMRRVDAQVRR